MSEPYVARDLPRNEMSCGDPLPVGTFSLITGALIPGLSNWLARKKKINNQ